MDVMSMLGKRVIERIKPSAITEMMTFNAITPMTGLVVIAVIKLVFGQL